MQSEACWTAVRLPDQIKRFHRQKFSCAVWFFSKTFSHQCQEERNKLSNTLPNSQVLWYLQWEKFLVSCPHSLQLLCNITADINPPPYWKSVSIDPEINTCNNSYAIDLPAPSPVPSLGGTHSRLWNRSFSEPKVWKNNPTCLGKREPMEFFSSIPNDYRNNTFLHILSQAKYARSPNSFMLKARSVPSIHNLRNIFKTSKALMPTHLS